MEPTETHTEAQGCASSAIKTMEEGKIIPYPRNFTIWYFYFSGKYPDLRAAMTSHLDDYSYFSEDRNTLIYQRFFGFTRIGIEVRKVTSGAGLALSRTSDHIKDMSAEVASARADIGVCCQRIEAAGANGEVGELSRRLLARVKRLEAASVNAEANLAEDLNTVSRLHREIEESQRETMTDALTGIANRELFDTTLRLSLEDRHLSASLCVILIDVDNLGIINEKQGFDTGDEILRTISRALSEAIKGRDMAARYGGDEFAIMITRVQLAEATKLARNIRCLIGMGKRATDIDLRDRVSKRITVSIGVSQYQPGETLKHFISRLRQAINTAKSNGRNQVISADNSGERITFWDEDNVVVNPGH